MGTTTIGFSFGVNKPFSFSELNESRDPVAKVGLGSVWESTVSVVVLANALMGTARVTVTKQQ